MVCKYLHNKSSDLYKIGEIGGGVIIIMVGRFIFYSIQVINNFYLSSRENGG